MNREIKFRAWDKKDKIWYLPDRFVINGDGRIWHRFNREITREVELNQYTGLKDKNGVEIYEGDIIQIGKDLIEEVSWVDENNWVGDKCPVNGWVNHRSIYKKPVKVIGNIYQNPLT